MGNIEFVGIINDFFNEETETKESIAIPVHELLHCIAGALVGLDMKFGIDPVSFMAFAYTENPLTKAQFLVMSLTPLIILAIIPLIILFVTYPKKEKSFRKGLIYWILTCFIGCMIMSSVRI